MRRASPEGVGILDSRGVENMNSLNNTGGGLKEKWSRTTDFIHVRIIP